MTKKTKTRKKRKSKGVSKVKPTKVEKKAVKEVVPPGQPLPESGDLPVPPAPKEPEIECGYVVGIKEDGSYVFDVLGTKPGLIELQGLHKVAMEHIDALFDQRRNGKFTFLGGKVDAAIGKIDQVAMMLSQTLKLMELERAGE